MTDGPCALWGVEYSAKYPLAGFDADAGGVSSYEGVGGACWGADNAVCWARYVESNLDTDW